MSHAKTVHVRAYIRVRKGCLEYICTAPGGARRSALPSLLGEDTYRPSEVI
jgi:hypothetical protein